MRRERTTGEELLDRGCKPGRCVVSDAPQNGLTLIAKVRAEQREQLHHDLILHFTGNLTTQTAPPMGVADLGEQRPIALHELPLFLELLGRTRSLCSSVTRAFSFET